MTKVNIYYGGRGLIEDPTIYVMDKITEVLNELNVVVLRYNLYEDKKGISVYGLAMEGCNSSVWMPAGCTVTKKPFNPYA